MINFKNKNKTPIIFRKIFVYVSNKKLILKKIIWHCIKNDKKKIYPDKFKSCQFQKECPLMCERLRYILWLIFLDFFIHMFRFYFIKYINKKVCQTKKHKLFYIKIHLNVYLIIPVSSQNQQQWRIRNILWILQTFIGVEV